jgi:hypothetical protein
MTEVFFASLRYWLFWVNAVSRKDAKQGRKGAKKIGADNERDI